MTNLGYLHYFVGLQILQTKEEIFLFQSKYACALLCHFHMEDSNPTPFSFEYGVRIGVTCTFAEVDSTSQHQLVDSLLYLTHACINVSFVVGFVFLYTQIP
jgi:hypothetical protein